MRSAISSMNAGTSSSSNGVRTVCLAAIAAATAEADGSLTAWAPEQGWGQTFTVYGGRATNIYADIYVNGSVTVSSEACAQSYNGAHFACGTFVSTPFTGGAHDISMGTWGAGWGPYDYYWVALGYVDGTGNWNVIGSGVSGT